jgi:alkanesulfonate monooxygenase SsuD/methylene tetrahydromethanopterin reductase-like flavin-dependent oxidoreductase (luciferase family)
MTVPDGVGVVLPRDLPPAEVLPYARRADELGFGSLWVVEDMTFRGGFAQAGAVLAATSRIHVALGIAPAAVRSAAFTAMEAATLAELFPGRFTLGIGHGSMAWMRQASAWPASPLTLLAEHLDAVRALLRGETVTAKGRYVRLDGVRLVTPPERPPAVVAGVRGPKSLAVSGEHADGTLLAEPVTPEYARAARAQIGADDRHLLHGYLLTAVDEDADRARQRIRPALEVAGMPDFAPHVATSPYAADLAALRADSADAEEFTRRMPDEWVDDLALVGTPQRLRERLAELRAAGLQRPVLFPVAGPGEEDRRESLTALAAAVLE